MESLYYLSSSINFPESVFDPENLILGNYFLAICYNLNHIPTIPLPTILENVEVKYLYGEPLIKTLIMLEKLNDFSLFEQTTSNLNYFSRASPSISKKLLSEFLVLLTNTLNANIDYYAVSTFFLNHITEFSQAEKYMIFSLLKGKWDQINPLFQSKMEKAIQLSDFNEVLVLHESNESRKKLISMHSQYEVSEKNMLLLEAMIKYKIIFHSSVIKYLNFSSSIKRENDLLKITYLIVELLSITGDYKNLLDSVFYIFDKYKIWPTLSKQDLLNMSFILCVSSSGLKIPSKVEESLKYSLVQIDENEDLISSLKNQLKYYRSFKYTTEFEKRRIVSNDIELREESPEVNVNPELPIDELIKYLKINAIVNNKNLTRPEECKNALDKYYKQRDKDFTIKNAKNEVLSIINDMHNGRNVLYNYSENFVDDKTG